MEMKGLAEGYPPPSRYSQRSSQKIDQFLQMPIHAHTLTHTFVAQNDLSNYRSEGPHRRAKLGHLGLQVERAAASPDWGLAQQRRDQPHAQTHRDDMRASTQTSPNANNNTHIHTPTC